MMMKQDQTSDLRPKPVFWVIAVLGLIWNLLGVGAFLVLQTSTKEELVQMYGAEQGAIAAAHPIGYSVIFALAVLGGVLGCLMLLLRNKFALWFFAVSFICTVLQLGYLIVIGAMSGLTLFEWLMPLMIPVVALLLLRHASKNVSRGLLS